MFSSKIVFNKVFLYKKVKVKKYLLLLLTFSQFSFFILFFQCFSSVSFYVQQFLGGLHLFWQDISLIFNDSTL